MGTPLLRCGQLVRTHIASATAQQLRHQSVFSDITSKLRQQVESNPELKEQLSKLKDTAGSLRQRAAAGAQQTQEVLEHLSNQQKGAGGSPGQQPGRQEEAGEQGLRGGSSGASASGAAFQQRDQQQQQPAGGAHASGSTAGGSAGSEGPSRDASGGACNGGASGAGGGGGAADSGADGASQQAGSQQAGWATKGRRALNTVWREVAEAISPTPDTTSATKRRAEGLRQASPKGGGPSEILIVEQPESAWRKQWRSFAGRYADHPLFRRLSSASNSAAARGRDAAEDIKERWETSDSPLVHRIQDMSDTVFTETEMARAYREIGARDPAFDMPAFLRQIKADVPVIIRAYLQGEIDVLKEHCSPEMVERLTAIIRAQQAQGMFSDPTLLDISDVELADIKFLEEDPVVVVQFNCQQINCTRDKFSNVTEGAPDEVQRVYYFWALQQEAAGFVGTNGQVYPPRWQLREMLVQGMMQLVS